MEAETLIKQRRLEANTTFGIDSGTRHDIAGDGGTQLIWVRRLAATAENFV